MKLFVCISTDNRMKILSENLEYDLPEESNWLCRPNPMTSGCRYMLTEHGKCIRTTWALPDYGSKHDDEKKGSGSGCHKKRYTFVGHRQRVGLWLVMCLQHQVVVGYHIMENGEGRRDAFVPLYRFKKHPPKALFSDYVCGIEETALNLHPEFWLQTSFYHDLFHGYTHSCTSRFMSRRHEQFSSLNTSAMEQVTNELLNDTFIYIFYFFH